MARIAANVCAARAYFDAQVAKLWGHALAGTAKNDALLAEASLGATWINATCVNAIDACFKLGGSRALFETSPLQRRMRDIHASAQHSAVMSAIMLPGPACFCAIRPPALLVRQGMKAATTLIHPRQRPERRLRSSEERET